MPPFLVISLPRSRYAEYSDRGAPWRSPVRSTDACAHDRRRASVTLRPPVSSSLTSSALAIVDLPEPGQAGEKHGEALLVTRRIGLAQFVRRPSGRRTSRESPDLRPGGDGTRCRRCSAPCHRSRLSSAGMYWARFSTYTIILNGTIEMSDLFFVLPRTVPAHRRDRRTAHRSNRCPGRHDRDRQ